MTVYPIRFSELSLGDRVAGLVCAWTCQAHRTRNDAPFLSLELRDATATVIPAVMWDTESDRAPDCPVVVYIEGDVGEFRGELQIRVVSLEITSHDIASYVPTSYRPLAELMDEFKSIVELVEDESLRDLIDACLERTPGFWTAPAAIGFHGAYRGGLLEHTLNVARVCLQAADIYRDRVNQDLLLAAALLHDIGKGDAYDSPERREPLEDERLLGHVIRGAMLVERTAHEIGYDGRVPLSDVLHPLLSHHGEMEYGAPVEPATAEALILSNADCLDADATGYFDLWRDHPGGESWTYSRQRRRWVRKPGERSEALTDLPF